MTTEHVMFLFPLVLMLHEFEEIIFLRLWFHRNKATLRTRFPVAGRHIVQHVERLSKAAFALIVAEELVIMSLVTVLEVMSELYLLFAGFVVAFLLHLIVHGVQFVIWRGYIPAIVTAVLTVPYCVAVLYLLAQVRGSNCCRSCSRRWPPRFS